MTFNQTLLFDNKVHAATLDWSACPRAVAGGGDYDGHKTTLASSHGVREEEGTIGSRALKEGRSGGIAEISPPDIPNWASRYFS